MLSFQEAARRRTALGGLLTSTGGTSTVGVELAASRGRAPGFDAMRLWLALAIVAFHAILVCYGKAAEETVVAGPFRPLILLALPMFFALSGFLIAGSMDRVRSLKVFAAHRLLRIVPALFCEVMLSALILGPLLTGFSMTEYFNDPMFAHYFLNIIGEIRFTLPGVFTDNPFPSIVNIQLWTIPIELKCYLVFAVLMAVGVVLNKRVMLLAFFGGILGLGALQWYGHHAQDPRDVVSGYILVINFLGGVTAYLWRDHVRLTAGILLASTVAAGVIFWSNWLIAISPVFTVYITVFLGMKRLPNIRLLAKGDYSYGIYLYGFPIQQMVAYLFPEHRTPLFNLALALPLTLCMAIVSWHLVEMRVLALKRHVRTSRQDALQARAADFVALAVAALALRLQQLRVVLGLRRHAAANRDTSHLPLENAP